MPIKNFFKNFRHKTPSKTKGNEQEGTAAAEAQEALDETAEIITVVQDGDDANIPGANEAVKALGEAEANPTPENVSKSNKILSRIKIKDLPENMRNKFTKMKNKLKELPKKLKEEKTKAKTKVTHIGSHNKDRVGSLKNDIQIVVNHLTQSGYLLNHLFAQGHGIICEEMPKTSNRSLSFNAETFRDTCIKQQDLFDINNRLTKLKDSSSVGAWYRNMVNALPKEPKDCEFATLNDKNKIQFAGDSRFDKNYGNIENYAPIKYLNNLVEAVNKAMDPNKVKKNTTIHTILCAMKYTPRSIKLQESDLAKRFKRFIEDNYPKPVKTKTPQSNKED